MNAIAEFVAKLGFQVDSKELEKFDNSLQGLVSTAKKVAVAIGAIGFGTYVVDSLLKTAEAADEVADSAKKIGIATNSLIQLRHAAEMSDVSAESLGQGLKFLGKNAVDSVKGSGDAYDAFRKLGVSVKDSNGRFKGADELLLEVSDGFAKLPDGIERTNLALTLFGRGGQDMVLLLGQGSASIKELEARAAKFGLTLSTETQKNVAEFDDSMTELKASQKGLFNQLLKALPGLNKFLPKLTELLLKAQPYIAKFGDGLGIMFDILADIAGGVGKLDFFSIITAGLAAIALGMSNVGIAAVKSGLKMAVAYAPMLLAMAALFVLVNEISTTLRGGDSLISRLEKFLLKDFSDSPVLEALASLLSLLQGLDSQTRQNRYLKAIGFTNPVVDRNPNMDNYTQKLSTIGESVPQYVPNASVLNKSQNSSVQNNTFNIQSTDPKTVASEVKRELMSSRNNAQP